MLREIAAREPKPASPATPTQFSTFPLSVYNETSDADQSHQPSQWHNSTSHGYNQTAVDNHVAAVVNDAAIDDDARNSGGDVRIITPVAPKRPSRRPPTTPGSADNSTVTSDSITALDGHATVSSQTALITGPDGMVRHSDRPTPKVRSSIRQKSTDAPVVPITMVSNNFDDSSRPEPRPRAMTAGKGDSPADTSLVSTSGKFTETVLENAAAEAMSSAQAPNDVTATMREDPEGSISAPPAVSEFVRSTRSSKRGSIRAQMQPPPRPPSIPPPTPPATSPQHVAEPSRPSRPAPAAPTPGDESLPPGSQSSSTVPFLHFDLTAMPSNASEMTYAADHRPDSYIIDL